MDQPEPAYKGDEPYVFVSYSHRDQALVYREIQWLQDQGVKVWYDEGISPGSDWSDSIAQHIESCSVFLYFITPRSVVSDHCRREVNYALDQPCRMLAIYLERTELPSGLKLTLSNRQAILKHGDSPAAYETKLLDAIDSAITPTTHTNFEIEEASEPSQRPLAQATNPKTNVNRGRPAIAVLPFKNLSNDPDQEYFSEGISEDILDGLARNRSLTVRARQSSFMFKEQDLDPVRVSDRLNVSYLVTGTVRTQGNRVRVAARLTDVGASADVWSNRYDREMSDIFAVQDDITESIVNALGLLFSEPVRQHVNVEAYDAFLLGRYHIGRFELGSAITAFEQAIDLEPQYAAAYSSLAQTYSIRSFLAAYSGHQSISNLLGKRRAYVQRALDAVPNEPLALGLEATWLKPQDALNRLSELIGHYPNDPNLMHFLANVFRFIGRIDLEVQILDQVVALDPLNVNNIATRAGAKVFGGDFVGASKDAERVERLGLPIPTVLAFHALYRRDITALRTQVDRDSAWVLMPQLRTILKAGAHFIKGDKPGVEEILTSFAPQEEHLSNLVKFWLSLLHGAYEDALEHFLKALRAGEPQAFYEVQGSYALRSVFPEYFALPGYEAMLCEFDLDSESVAKLVIPKLPF